MAAPTTAKQVLREAFDGLPDDASAEVILSDLHYRAKIMRGLDELSRGETIEHDEVMERIERWLGFTT